MKIEDLNKTQVVMLTLLTSFVTSIATGIVTVSLMEEAPQTLPQTINRVIERTVEKVTPAIEGKPTVVTKETTVVVKEEDLITKSISSVGNSMVAVLGRRINTEGLAEDVFLGWGFVVSESGRIVTDSVLIADDGSYTLRTSNNIAFNSKVISQNEKMGIAILEATPDRTKKEEADYVWKPITVAKASSLKLGQTAIVAGGRGKLSVAVGTITSIGELDQGLETASSTGAVLPKYIEASASSPSNIRGALLTNSFGETAGVYLGAELGGQNVFMPIEKVLGAI